MIVNGKSIKGIFKYSDELTYEESDFVIENNGLFVCTSETSTGNKPSESPDYFKPYLNEKCISVQEYLDEIDNPTEGEDKYLSASALSGILNYYMSGFDEKGEITNSVEILDNGEITITGGEVSISNPLRSSDEVLDYLINVETLNNAVFKLDAKLFGDEYTHPKILRQYTYRQNTKRYRLQELIDVNTGGVEYRVADSKTIGSWKSISDNEELNNEIQSLKNYYSSLVTKYDETLNEVRNSFRWKVVKPDSHNLQYVFISESGNMIYTIVVNWEEDGKLKSQNLTTTGKGGQTTYYITPTIYVTVSLTVNNGTTTSASISVNGSATIDCVYYSKYYDFSSGNNGN